MTQLHPQRFIPWVFFIFGLLFLALTTWPLPVEHSQWSAVSINSSNWDFSFTLDWPSSIRVGEPKTAILKVAQNNGLSGDNMLEARLEFPELVINPNGTIVQPAGNQENPLEYRWSLTALQPGEVNGTLWIYLVSQDAEGDEQRDALVARSLELKASSIFGLSIPSVRWIGGILIIISMPWIIRQVYRCKNGTI